MQKKYEITDIVHPENPALRRIRALIDFSDVLAGDLGGYVETEDNLSHTDKAWVYEDAQVYGDAKVYGNAGVYGDAKVYGNAEVSGDAEVSGNARVYGNAWVVGNARVSGDAWVYGNAGVYGDAKVYGNAEVSGNAKVYGNAEVYENARVSGNAEVYENAKVTHCLWAQQPKHSITYTDTHVFIGCQGHTWEHWDSHIESIGRQHDYSPEEIQDVRELLAVMHRQVKRAIASQSRAE